MSKTTKTPTKKAAAKKSASRWSLGVFESAKTPGQLIVLYCRVDGTVMKSYRHAATAAKAKFNASYKGITYAEARAKVLKESGLEKKVPAASTKKTKKAAPKKAAPKEEIRKAA